MKKILTLFALGFLLILALPTPVLAAGSASGIGDLVLFFFSIPAFIAYIFNFICSLLIKRCKHKISVISCIFTLSCLLALSLLTYEIFIYVAFIRKTDGFGSVAVLTLIAFLWSVINTTLSGKILFSQPKTTPEVVNKVADMETEQKN